MPTLILRSYRSRPLAIVDSKQRILVMCAGQPLPGPQSKPWPVEALNRLIRVVRRHARISLRRRNHRRGKYATMHAGISYGGGQRVRPSFIVRESTLAHPQFSLDSAHAISYHQVREMLNC